MTFKIYWQQHSNACVLSFWIVKEFDIIEQVSASVFAGRILSRPDLLSFKKLKKALRNGVIVAISQLVMLAPKLLAFWNFPIHNWVYFLHLN